MDKYTGIMRCERNVRRVVEPLEGSQRCVILDGEYYGRATIIFFSPCWQQANIERHKKGRKGALFQLRRRRELDGGVKCHSMGQSEKIQASSVMATLTNLNRRLKWKHHQL